MFSHIVLKSYKKILNPYFYQNFALPLTSK